MLERDRMFWKNVATSLERGDLFQKELRSLLGRRVNEVLTKAETLEETESQIRAYCEAIGDLMVLKDAVIDAVKNDSKEISAKIAMQENWPTELWERLHSYFDFNAIDYEIDKKKEKITLYRDEDVIGLVDDYSYEDADGNVVLETPQNLICGDCTSCPYADEC